jgi:hypothetical protein
VISRIWRLLQDELRLKVVLQMGRYKKKVVCFLLKLQIAISIVLSAFIPLLAHAESIETSDSDVSVNWKGVFFESGLFLGIQHAFRFGTEPGTRDGMAGSFWPNYLDAVGNYHGWSDGDEFLINYIGHPMEGAVVNYIFRRNDPKYRMTEFGRNAAYWKGQLRATAYAFAYSTQFELGPIASEASLGHIQSYYPQQGFVDVVITPTLGLGWGIAEDVLDKYVVKYVESRTRNSLVRLLVRSWLNPSRSFANAMRFRRPWERDDRPGVTGYDPVTWKNLYASVPYGPQRSSGLAQSSLLPSDQKWRKRGGDQIFPTIPSLEIAFHADYLYHSQYGQGSGNMIGGGATGVFNLNRWASFVIDVTGYKMSSQGPNLSGDSLSYLFGPRFAFRPSDRFTLYTDILVGGNKLLQEQEYPDRKPPAGTVFNCGRSEADCEYWTHHDRWETNGFAVSLGGGLDVALNRVLAFRVYNLQYVHTSIKQFAMGDYSNMFRFSTGFVIRTGNW